MGQTIDQVGFVYTHITFFHNTVKALNTYRNFHNFAFNDVLANIQKNLWDNLGNRRNNAK